MRGRNHRGSGSGGGGGAPVRQQGGNVPMNRNHVFDSSGPDMRIRGTSQQLFEKYLQMGRDATGSGDRVMAEHYFQHAEHYFRILNAMNQAAQQNGQGAAPPNGQGNAPSNQQRRYDSNDDQTEQGGDDEHGMPGTGDQPVMEARPIAINAGSPEAE